MKTITNDKIAKICMWLLLVMIICALLAPWLAPYQPNETNMNHRLESISAQHILGTDELGRDLLSRILYGGRVTLLLGVTLTLLIALVGVILGVLANIAGKQVKYIIDLLCGMFLALPSEMLSLMIIAIVGPSLLGLVLAIVLTRWPWYVKMIEDEIQVVLHKNYVTFAKISQKSIWWILRYHVWPNVKASIIVYTTLDMGALIMSMAALSFLGIGIQPPTAEWGRMLNDAREVAVVYPWQMIPAGVMIFVVTALLNYLGDYFSETTIKGQEGI